MNVSDSRVNLIQGSVIYMKKMSSSKRGFTLTEILIVTAIVIIVSAAAFAGVAITLSRARDTQKNLKENNGDNFELAARSEVDAINENAADFAEIPSYKPKDSEATEEDDDTEGSDDTNGGGEPKTTPTPLPTNTPTPKPSETSATTTAHSGGGTTTVGHVTATLVPQYSKQKGVVSVTGTGNTQTLVLQNADGWCPDNAEFTITKTNSGYTLTVPDHDFRYQMDQNLFKDLYKTYTYPNLNNDQINYLKDSWGIELD